jgi:hypothetical protein
MFKINNSTITLNKHDKSNILKKILELKKKTSLHDKQSDKQSEDQYIIIQQPVQKDTTIVQPTHQEPIITDTDEHYLSIKDKELLQLFINTLDLHTFDIWDNIIKKYKILYNLLRNGDDPTVQMDNMPYRYSYSDLLFIQMLINYNMYALPTWEDATIKIKYFFDKVYSIFNVQTTSTNTVDTHTPLTVTVYQRPQYPQEEEENSDDIDSSGEEDSEDDDPEFQYKQNMYSDIEFETDSDVSSFDFDDSDGSDDSDDSDDSDGSDGSDDNDKSK